jgi:hypothetical protein
MSKYEPTRIGERFLDGCIGVCLGAVALYGAVWLLIQIWLWLAGIALVVGAVGVARWWWRRW